MNSNNITPQIGFDISIQQPSQSTRIDGIVHVVAATTQGEEADPRQVITSSAAFRDLYGEEIVPDGGLSNIEKMLDLGAAVRVSRVVDTTSSTAWQASAQALSHYDDSYVLVSSHVHQHLTSGPNDLIEYYAFVHNTILSQHNIIHFIEIPNKSSSTGENMTYDEMIAYKQGLENVLPSNPFTAFFAGGLTYFNSTGDQIECDSIGTAAALAALSEMEFGPWYHFSGLNRGKVTSAIGIVTENYGSNMNQEKLQQLAEESINVFVVKSTRVNGRVPCLWHNFTSYDQASSFRFLGISRLFLYIKKNILPILESYLEEPNIPSTWDAIAAKVEPILTDLVDRNAITSYDWQGDQNLSSISDVAINQLSDIYKGSYKAQLVIEEVIATQKIQIDIILNTVTGEASVTTS